MSSPISEPHKSSIGNVDANVMALIEYLLTTIAGFIPVIGYVAWLAPLVLFYVEKESTFVKFHAMQAFVLQACGSVLGFLVSVVLGGIVTVISMLGASYIAYVAAGALSVLSVVVMLAVAAFAILAMVKAYGYKEYSIPLIGKLSEKIGERLNNVRP